MQPRTEPDWDAYVRDFDFYAAHFAVSHEAQAEWARRVRKDTERNAARQAAADAKRVADERERVGKERP